MLEAESNFAEPPEEYWYEYMTSVDEEGKWTCVNTQCEYFDTWMAVTTLQSRWWEQEGVAPDCPYCHETMRFVDWDRSD